MLMSQGCTRLRRVVAAAVLSIAPTLGAACSAGDSTDASASTRPEDHVATPAEVTEGLADVRALADQVVAQLDADQASAERTVDAMYDRWFEFEGTVRRDDTDLYLQMEDGLSGVRAGVEDRELDRVERGLADLAEAADAYLATHGTEGTS
jgi:hypothetical protein